MALPRVFGEKHNRYSDLLKSGCSYLTFCSALNPPVDQRLFNVGTLFTYNQDDTIRTLVGAPINLITKLAKGLPDETFNQLQAAPRTSSWQQILPLRSNGSSQSVINLNGPQTPINLGYYGILNPFP